MFELNRARRSNRQWLQNSNRRFRRRQQHHRRNLQAVERLEDRTLLTIDTLSVAAGEMTGDGRSNDPQLSRDGRYVAYQSDAENLDLALGSDSNGFQDIFVRNIDDGTTVLISRNGGGRSGDDDSWSPTISDNGRFVAFASFATDLIPDVTITAGPNVFVHDRDLDGDGIYDEPGETITRLLSRNGEMSLFGSSMGATSGNGPSGGIALGPQWQNRPVISGDGRFVTYVSAATNLLDPADGVTVTVGPNLYVSPTDGGKTILVSVDSTGTTSGVLFGGGTADTPSISTDGRYIAFYSNYENLIDDDVEGERDIFVRDVFGGTTTRVSVNSAGKAGNGPSREPVISRDGRHVVFTSQADNLVPGDTNGRDDIFVHNLKTRATSLISVSRDPASVSSTGNAASPATAGNVEAGYDISDTGRYVLFTSLASDLLDPASGIIDENDTTDVFLFDRDADGDGLYDEVGPGGTSTELLSINAEGTEAANALSTSGGSSAVSISGDGRFAVFSSPGTDLIPGDADGTGVYLRDLVAGATELIGLVGTPAAPQVGVAESGLSTAPLRVAFSSFALGVDADVADENDAGDVFLYNSAADLRFRIATADGYERLVLGYSIENAAVESPFEIGVYLSTDGTFDPGEDELLDTILISGSGLSLGDHKRAYRIGDEEERDVILPGAGAPEVDGDYQILFVLDHLDTQEERDSDPLNEDNTGRFEGVYHPVGGPVFAHGRTTPGFESDRFIVTEVDADTMTVRLNRQVREYDPADVTSVRFRGHGGRDYAQAGSTDDLLLGGAGRDELRGGAGDDIIGGGPDADSIFGEAGFDTVYDGSGDDMVDLGEDGGVVLATPGSDDIFIDGSGSDTIDFSFDDLEITLDLDSTVVQTVDADLNTVQLIGQWENFIGSPVGNTLLVDPLAVARRLQGGVGFDTVIIDALGNPATSDGTTVTIPGFGPITLFDFEEIFVINTPPQIIDDSAETGFTHNGFFDSSPDFPQGFDDGVKFSGANSGNTATWTFSDLPPGRYSVATTWTFAPDRAANSPFTIYDGNSAGTIVAQTMVDQEKEPDDFEADGFGWSRLGTVDITGTTLTVELTDDGADEFVVADAIRIEPLSPYGWEIDDGDTGFTGSGTRLTGAGQFGDQVAFPPGNEEVLSTYEVAALLGGPIVKDKAWFFATWDADGQAVTDSEFTIFNGVDVLTTTVNQQLPPDDIVINGISWEILGVADVIDPADLKVELHRNPNGYVIADAIRIEPFTELTFFDNSKDGIRIPVTEGSTIDFDTVPRDRTSGRAVRTETFVVRNDGAVPYSFETQLLGLDAGFTLLSPSSVTLPPGSETNVIVEFDNDSLGTWNDTLQFNFTNPLRGLPGSVIELTADVVDDDTPPTVEIVSPSAGSSIVEGSTITLHVDANDDVGVRSVELLVDGEVVGSSLSTESPNPLVPGTNVYRFDYEVPVGAGPDLEISALATDTAGNSSELDIVNFIVDFTPLPTITIDSLPLEPLGAPGLFTLPISINDPFGQVDYSTSPYEVDFFFPDSTDTTFAVPIAGDYFTYSLPPLPGNGPTSITGSVVDIFGNRVFAEPVIFAPAEPLTFTGPAPRVNTLRPTISWNPGPGGVRYDVWLLDLQTEKVIRDKNVTGTSWTPPQNLLLGNYRVWVRCFDADGKASPWNEPFDFNVDLPVPEPLSLNLLSPESDPTPLFGWGTSLFDYDNDGDTDIIYHGELLLEGPIGSDSSTLLLPFVPLANLFEIEHTNRDGNFSIQNRLINEAGVPGPWSEPLPFTITSAAPTGVIAGRNWHDFNGDGVQDSDEPGLDGWTVEVVNAAGQVYASTVTASVDLDDSGEIDPLTETGVYQFEVPAGPWFVRVVSPDGWRRTLPQGDDVAETAFELDRQYDFQPPDASYANWGGRGERWFFSNTAERWFFIDPDGAVFQWNGSGRKNLTGTKVGQLDGSYHDDLARLNMAVDPGMLVVDVFAGETTANVDFGNLALGAIEGRKWNDLDGDGVRDGNEPWLNGWTITLLDTQGNVIDTTVTADRDLNNDQQIDPETEAGWYVFERLGNGSFVLEEEMRNDWTQTFPNRELAQTILDLDQAQGFHSTAPEYFNWGGLNEHWLEGNDGWYFIQPDGKLYKWNNSPRGKLTGTLVATLTPGYWANPERIFDAITPGKYRINVDEATVSDVDFGNREN